MLKRAIDLVCAAVFGIVLAPLALLIALVIELESRGPLLYHSRRVGRAGRLFFYHRLRLVKGSPYQPPHERTRFGRLIGNLSLDEIPGLWNVLVGEMSLVGPRPERPENVDLGDPDWRKVLSVRPGLIGMGLLTFLDRYNQTSVKERIGPELYYVGNRSLLLDSKILLKTFHFWMRMGHLKGRY